MGLVQTHAVPQVEPSGTGIHLLWLGPPAFIFAPSGWRIERRKHTGPPRVRVHCDVLESDRVARIRKLSELPLREGVWTVRPGVWPIAPGGACEIYTCELRQPAGGLHGRYEGSSALIYTTRHGKAVGGAGPLLGEFDLGPDTIDRIVIYALGIKTIRLCVRDEDTRPWDDATHLADLTLPLREFDSTLATPEAELAEARRRLLPGDVLEEQKFRDLSALLRVGLTPKEGRPSQHTLLMRDDGDDDYEEVSALDPLRMVYADPMWRRALGFAYFDHDPALVPGERYDYRVSASFPAAGLHEDLYSFHPLPAGTVLPSHFHLGPALFRTPAPVTVERAPGTPLGAPLVLTRRGIRLTGENTLPWIGFGIEGASLVIDFPEPTSTVTLELEAGHDLRFESGDEWTSTTAPAPVPPGTRPVLTLAAPSTQLRLRGRGFLFAVSSQPDDQTKTLLVGTAIGVRFVNTPRPEPPLLVRAATLQRGASFSPSSAAVKTRHQLGIDVRWQPAPKPGAPVWPGDLDASSPLDATVFQIERRHEPDGAWTPVLPGRNVTLGSRDDRSRPRPRIRHAANVVEAFAEVAPAVTIDTDFSWRDVFLVDNGTGARDTPPPGTLLRYRVRALDVIGRPSDQWRESNVERLEKHEAPPLPAAPDLRPADDPARTGPTGLNADVLVRGAADLSDADRATLGSSQNAIVLRWGWHAKQRQQDPHATEFRVYLASPLDQIPGAIQTITPDAARPGRYTVRMTLARPVIADAASGLYLESDTPFFIEGHTGGATIDVRLRTSVPLPDGSFRSPVVGAARLPLKHARTFTAASSWGERLELAPGRAFEPITAETVYQAVIRDRLTLTPDHPSDEIWVGVTAADSEAYVPDVFPNPPGGPRPGNESAVASVVCQARLRQRPVFTPPLALVDVPRVHAPEPVNGPVRFSLDLGPHLAFAGLAATDLVQPERLLADALIEAFAVREGRLFAQVVDPRAEGDSDREIVLPNPDDHAAVIAAIATGDADALADRYVVFLAGAHPYRHRLFRATGVAVPFAPFEEMLAPRGGRYVYRVRRADALGQLSPDGAVARAIVRLPSLMPGPPPRRGPRADGDVPEMLRMTVTKDPRLEHLLVFEYQPTPGAAADVVSLVRVPNRPDLYPAGAVRLRHGDGALTTARAASLAPSPVDGRVLEATTMLERRPGATVAVWACSVTVDGIPSALAGPWFIAFV